MEGIGILSYIQRIAIYDLENLIIIQRIPAFSTRNIEYSAWSFMETLCSLKAIAMPPKQSL